RKVRRGDDVSENSGRVCATAILTSAGTCIAGEHCKTSLALRRKAKSHRSIDVYPNYTEGKFLKWNCASYLGPTLASRRCVSELALLGVSPSNTDTQLRSGLLSTLWSRQ